MRLLTPVIATDNKIGTAIAKAGQNSPQALQLREAKAAQITALSVGLSGITINVLPEVLKHGEQVSALRKADENTLLRALVILIGLANEAMNVPRMNNLQMANAARHITKTFWYLKIEEIVYAFDQGRAGRYGKSYNRLDLEILESWLTAYDTTERMILCERSRNEQKEADEADNNHSLEFVRESYQKSMNGETTVQQKLDQQRREADRTERIEKNKFQQYRDQYFKNREQIGNHDEQ